MATPFLDEINNVFGANLARLWPLHETSGTTANDESNNADGTYIGATLGQDALSADAGAHSIETDGVDDEVDQAVYGQSGANDQPPITMFLLARSGVYQEEKYLLHWGRPTSSRRQYGIVCDENGKIALLSENSNNSPSLELVTSSVDVDDGETHLIVATWRSTADRELYIDGVSVAFSDVSRSFAASGSDWYFSVANGRVDGTAFPAEGNAYYAGRCEYAGLANQGVTAQQVSDLWDAASEDPSITATADLTAAAAEMSGSATHEPPEFSASAAWSIAPVELSASAEHTSPESVASADLTMGAAMFSAAVEVEDPQVTATAEFVVGAAVFSGAAQTEPPEATAAGQWDMAAAVFDASAVAEPPQFAASADLVTAAVVFAGVAGEPVEVVARVCLDVDEQIRYSLSVTEKPRYGLEVSEMVCSGGQAS